MSKAYDQNNIFAKILRGEIPNKTVLDNDHVLAFHDVAPQAHVHILIIPKGDYIDATDFGARASAEEIHAFFSAITTIAQIDALKFGYRLIANTGHDGGQEVPHFHMHILGGETIGKLRG